jgi:hypothetical protein
MNETRIQSTLGAVTAVLNVLVLLDWVHLTDVQIAGITTALLAVMGAVRVWFEPKISIVGVK